MEIQETILFSKDTTKQGNQTEISPSLDYSISHTPQLHVIHL